MSESKLPLKLNSLHFIHRTNLVTFSLVRYNSDINVQKCITILVAFEKVLTYDCADNLQKINPDLKEVEYVPNWNL